ncbi:MAG: hypothetical protein PHD53_10320, partial [Methylococcales bacterium]|nr:hypothetical protein [Methylococcales bacterium]
MNSYQSKNKMRSEILSTLWQPLTEIGKNALESFIALPQIENWKPERWLLGELSQVFDVGLPFALLKDNESLTEHKNCIGNAIGQNQQIPISDFSELQVAAILSNWNANVKFLPRSNFKRMPDIEAFWNNDCITDVEITRAKIRQPHQAIQDNLKIFSEAVRADDFNWNIICFMADASNSEELNLVFDVFTKLQLGQNAEHFGRWYVQTVPIEQSDDVVGANVIELFAPTWWEHG